MLHSSDPDLLDCSTPGPAAPAAVEKASIFRPRCILLRTVNMAFQWFAVNLTFYGLSFTSTSLAGDPHLNFSLSIVSEIPGTLLCLWLLRRGRQRSLVLCQLVSGICCIAAGLLMVCGRCRATLRGSLCGSLAHPGHWVALESLGIPIAVLPPSFTPFLVL